MKRKITILILALALLAAGPAGWLLAPSPSGPELADLLDMPKTAMQLKLYSAAKDPKTGASVSGIRVGYDYYSKDGMRKTHSVNAYESGATEDVYYRGDGSKESSRDYYSLEHGEKLPLLRSEARFDSTGNTYVSHDVKRRDGSWERRGKLLADGNYEQVYYCADGKTAEKIQLFDKGKRFLSEKAIFCHNGKPIRETQDGDYGQKILILFNPDGSTAAKVSRMDCDEAGVCMEGDVFGNNGEVTLHFSTSGYGGDYKVYSGGKLVMLWSESSYMETKIEVTIYDSTNPERKLFTQHYKAKEAWKPEKGKILTGASEYDAQNKIIREIETDDQANPIRIILPQDGGKKLLQTLDPASARIIKNVLVDGDKELDQPLPKNTSVSFLKDLFKDFQRPETPGFDDGSAGNGGSRVYDFW